MRIPVVERITKANDQVAELNRELLNRHGVLGLNILASPGAGKTTLIEKTVPRLKERFRIGVVEGDIATNMDAERTSAAGAVSVQINTGGSCHLDASMVRDALNQIPLDELDLVIVENVGNLICPAAFDLGTHHNVLVASIPEGDDKPYKYPRTYRGVDALIINKTDLLPHVDFDLDKFKRGVEILNERVASFPLSCRTGEGLEPWIDWLGEQIRRTAAAKP
ncbi:MAG: hydrogenase nickel incorporation protein HypB [Candidatus Eisenbacteria bacterium]|nr:hydrogenase nickel incorporation protein HypB [Candidatus Eisenbacteria bacterium]